MKTVFRCFEHTGFQTFYLYFKTKLSTLTSYFIRENDDCIATQVTSWKLSKMENEMSKSKRHLRCLDLFCGAGGLSCGLSMTGIDTVTGIDFDSAAIETLVFVELLCVR